MEPFKPGSDFIVSQSKEESREKENRDILMDYYDEAPLSPEQALHFKYLISEVNMNISKPLMFTGRLESEDVPLALCIPVTMSLKESKEAFIDLVLVVEADVFLNTDSVTGDKFYTYGFVSATIKHESLQTVANSFRDLRMKTFTSSTIAPNPSVAEVVRVCATFMSALIPSTLQSAAVISNAFLTNMPIVKI